MLARGEAAPLRFLLAVAILWVALRGAMLAGWHPGGGGAAAGGWGPVPGLLLVRWPAGGAPAVPPPGRTTAPVPAPAARPAPPPPAAPPAAPPSAGPSRAGPLRVGEAMADRRAMHLLALAAYAGNGPYYARATGQAAVATAAAATPAAAAAPRRWSGSAWALLRGGDGDATALATGGRIGGGQAGARVLYRLDRAGRVAASARLSRAIGGPRQTEAALGVDVAPLPGLHLLAERRVAIDRGGRDAFAAGVAGGVYAVPLADGWRLDGYAEAGMVGLARRDLYADGAVRAGRAIALAGDATLTVGGGAWGAAQPGAERLDVGPSAVLRLPAADRTVAVAIDWRGRVAGDARPRSGLALTVGVDF